MPKQITKLDKFDVGIASGLDEIEFLEALLFHLNKGSFNDLKISKLAVKERLKYLS